jgi:hypothetical protein
MSIGGVCPIALHVNQQHFDRLSATALCDDKCLLYASIEGFNAIIYVAEFSSVLACVDT